MPLMQRNSFWNLKSFLIFFKNKHLNKLINIFRGRPALIVTICGIRTLHETYLTETFKTCIRFSHPTIIHVTINNHYDCVIVQL